MANSRSVHLTSAATRWISDVGDLVKWKLTFIVVFSSAASYAIAAGSQIQILSLAVLAVGGFLVAGAANAMNEVLERDYDRLMRRTAQRPVASGRMAVSEAVVIAGVMLMLGLILLALFNPLTSFLGVLSFVLYAFIYTPLKRYSTASVAVGAIPGALPALIGCVAYQGEITWLAIVLFSVQFLWQFPHFWAIGWLAFDQYRDAGFKLLPSQDGKVHPSLGINSVIYAALLLPVCGLAYLTGTTDVLTTSLLCAASVWYVYKSYRFYSSFNSQAARSLMFSSFGYLPLVLCIIWLGTIM